jgi:hypothetical protein
VAAQGGNQELGVPPAFELGTSRRSTFLDVLVAEGETEELLRRLAALSSCNSPPPRTATRRAAAGDEGCGSAVRPA